MITNFLFNDLNIQLSSYPSQIFFSDQMSLFDGLIKFI